VCTSPNTVGALNSFRSYNLQLNALVLGLPFVTYEKKTIVSVLPRVFAYDGGELTTFNMNVLLNSAVNLYEGSLVLAFDEFTVGAVRVALNQPIHNNTNSFSVSTSSLTAGVHNVELYKLFV